MTCSAGFLEHFLWFPFSLDFRLFYSAANELNFLRRLGEDLGQDLVGEEKKMKRERLSNLKGSVGLILIFCNVGYYCTSTSLFLFSSDVECLLFLINLWF